MALVLGYSASVERRLRGILEQLGAELHEIAVVAVCLVELKHREFRVVVLGEPLIAEVAIDFVDAV